MSETTSTGPIGTLTVDGDSAGVRFERVYATTPADLWQAVTDVERLSRWLGPVTTDGARYRAALGESEDQWAQGEVLSCDPPRTYTVSWSFPGETGSEVTVEVAEAEGGALLVLDHRRLPAAAAAGYGAGWHAYLEHLRAELDGRPMPDWEAIFEACLETYRGLLP